MPKFISFVLQSTQQKAYAEQIAYGPVNTQAIEQIDPKRLDNMPTSARNLENQVSMNAAFWADHGEQLEQRFNAWASR